MPGLGPWLVLAAAFILTACGMQPPRTAESGSTPQPDTRRPPTSKSPGGKRPQVVLKKGGGFYKDDGPAEDIPDNLDEIPDAEPRWEPIHKPATKPYVVLGKEYVPNTTVRPYKASGIASWYGRKFHGQKTSIGEPYDMFAMTAAHPTLAIPSYVRVTNLQNGKSVIVRVTDRGPFHADRIIDLSYTAAWKLGLVNNGSGTVEVEALVPGESGVIAYTRTNPAGQQPEPDGIEALLSRLAMDEPPAPPQDAALERGVYLQLGAFSSADNAESLKSHLARELEWLTEPMRIQVSSGVHRVQLGPYANRNEATKVAEKIRLALGFKPTVVVR